MAASLLPTDPNYWKKKTIGQYGLPTYTTPAVAATGTSTAVTAAPTLKAPTYPALPDYSTQTKQSMANIDSLLNPSYADMDETRMKAAANAAASGTVGSGFANSGMLKMLDSEKIARQQLGSQLLEPYLQRNTTLQTAQMGQEGDNYRALLDAQQAMERLKLSESGQTARMTQDEAAQMQRLVVQGQQAAANIAQQNSGAMEQLKYKSAAELQNIIQDGKQAMERIQLSEKGQGERLTEELKNRLQNTVLLGQNALAQTMMQGQNQMALGKQSGQYGLEETSLKGQYGQAATNLNPLTQAALAKNLTGNGSALQDAQTIGKRYDPYGGNKTIVNVQGQTPEMFGGGSQTTNPDPYANWTDEELNNALFGGG
jgi:hypothetical protein